MPEGRGEEKEEEEEEDGENHQDLPAAGSWASVGPLQDSFVLEWLGHLKLFWEGYEGEGYWSMTLEEDKEERPLCFFTSWRSFAKGRKEFV